MAEKKQQEFTVTDRRLFNSEGELRSDVPEEPTQKPHPAATQTAAPQTAPPAPPAEDSEMPPPPTAAEQKQQADAYRQSISDMDRRVELSGQSSRELGITFERFMASLYMSAMLQLGLMHEEGAQPRIDLLGARQTIDTLGLIQEKTRGNLSAAEESFLQNCLYELRMAWLEVTNALARGPQNPAKGGDSAAR